MRKLIVFLLIVNSQFLSGQLSESLLNKIRYASEDYYISMDTLTISGTKTLPCLDVMINGRGPFRFLIDLGSGILNFKQSVIEEANMSILIDRERGDIAMAQKLQIGKSVFLDVYGAVYDNLDVDGVLGYNLLSKENFIMDYPNMHFAFLADNFEIIDSSYVKYEEIGRMPYLKSKIGKKDVFINFDTGASGWLYFPSIMKDSVKLKTPVLEGEKLWNNQTGISQSSHAQISDDVSFGNFLIKEPSVIFLPDIEDVFVGSSLLSDFKLTFYTSQKLVKMERAKEGRLISVPNKIQNIK